jgi:hypothetical protein
MKTIQQPATEADNGKLYSPLALATCYALANYQTNFR